MSDDISKDDELLELFLDEAREHLDGIEVNLLTIEKNGANIDDDLVNKVFRAVHSVKGASGFFGLTRAKDLSHSMENILGLIRKKEMVPTPAIISLLLDAADVLVNMINNPSTINEIDISKNTSELNSLLSGNLNEDKKQAVKENIDIKTPNGHTVFTVTAFELEQAIKAENGGECVYLVEYDLINDIQRNSKTPYNVISELLELTSLIDSKLDVEAVGLLDEFSNSTVIPFYILFASVMEFNIAVDLLGLDKKQIHQVQHNICCGEQDDLDSESCQAGQDDVTEGNVSESVATLSSSSPAQNTENSNETVEVPAKKDIQSSKPVQEAKAVKSSPKSSGSIRVALDLLDGLMTLAGELVLTRNQLIQSVGDENFQETEKSAQRIDQITTELQDVIMSTRMQSIDIVFHKFRRVVRDMSSDLGKKVKLLLEGEDVELDKTIIESINDPLTHLVRNSVDHGIEASDVRIANGKSEEGTLKLTAFHKAGQVVITIEDDGGGIDPEKIKEKALSLGMHSPEHLNSMNSQALIRLIFAPGFSTAETVTDVSGRGVGMDVVNSNITKLGGVIDIDSTIGEGTSITIKLPLTLTIIPCLMVSEESEQFAIPQANLLELQRIPAHEVNKKIEKIGGANVIRRRGELLPLVRLRDVLGIKRKTFLNPETGDRIEDRRSSVVDLRLVESEDGADTSSVSEGACRNSRQSAVNIAVVAAGDFHYGIIVEGMQDSSEIVVKPLGSHIRNCRMYAGATILGDGKSALILDVMGIGNIIIHDDISDIKSIQTRKEDIEKDAEDVQTILLIESGALDYFAIPLSLVERIEKINKEQITIIGGQRTMKYRGESLLLFTIDDVASVAPLKECDRLYVIVYRIAGREVGLLVSNLVDTIESGSKIDDKTHVQPGIFGSLLLNQRITLMLDIQGIASHLMPDLADNEKKWNDEGLKKDEKTVLVVDDSRFFLTKIKSFIEEEGYKTLTAIHGLEAIDVLEHNCGKIDLVLTDIEMPELDGFALSQKIRKDDRFRDIPIIAVTSVVGEAAESRGKEVGIDEYLIKLDRDQIIERSEYFLKNGRVNT